MTGQEFLARIREDESAVPSGHLTIKGATGYEVIVKWHELMREYNDRKTVWERIIYLYQIEYRPLEEI